MGPLSIGAFSELINQTKYLIHVVHTLVPVWFFPFTLNTFSPVMLLFISVVIR